MLAQLQFCLSVPSITQVFHQHNITASVAQHTAQLHAGCWLQTESMIIR